jgi:hypothetical protein
MCIQNRVCNTTERITRRSDSRQGAATVSHTPGTAKDRLVLIGTQCERST